MELFGMSKRIFCLTCQSVACQNGLKRGFGFDMPKFGMSFGMSTNNYSEENGIKAGKSP